MRAVVTRVLSASVRIEDREEAVIGPGLLVLLGVGPADTDDTARRMAEKICALRIFSDEAGKMNWNVATAGGTLLVVSQFTLYANTKSRRPGFTDAAPPALAEALYEAFLRHCAALGHPPQAGHFGADMQVCSVNDGPVTICFDSADWTA